MNKPETNPRMSEDVVKKKGVYKNLLTGVYIKYIFFIHYNK
jgi:hypothetical protein